MTPGETLRDVIGCGVQLTPPEAVAVAQLLIASASIERHRLPSTGPFSSDHVRLGADGSVTCDGCTVPTCASEVGMLLAEMLPNDGATRVPGALRYIVARALSAVEAPPFDSLADLSAALSRHERGDRVAVVRELYARVASKVPKPPAIPVERRRQGPSAATLRRQLRDADQALFSHLHPLVASLAAAQLAPPAAAEMEPFILHSEFAPVAVAGDGFNTTAWAAAATAALLISFGAGYAAVAGVRATHDARLATQGQPSAGASTD